MCVSTSESLNISDWGCYLDSPFVQRGKELREVLHLFTQAYLYHQLEHKEEGRLWEATALSSLQGSQQASILSSFQAENWETKLPQNKNT